MKRLKSLLAVAIALTLLTATSAAAGAASGLSMHVALGGPGSQSALLALTLLLTRSALPKHPVETGVSSSAPETTDLVRGNPTGAMPKPAAERRETEHTAALAW